MGTQDRKIQILLMGGTIDAHWEGKVDTAVINETSAIPDYFKNLIIYADIEFETIVLKDSRQIVTADLGRLRDTIEKSAYTKIIITHGTYTMPDTAKFLKANLVRRDQVVILTGSMVPLKGFQADASDAPFNLGYAMAKIEDLTSGVYLCMNGRTFSPEEVAKNLGEGKFYSVFERQQ
jgi:L-asparaginase